MKRSFTFADTSIVLVVGDITQQSVHAIVNAANSGLLGGGGVDGAIHRAAGPTLLSECRRIREESGTCPTGEVRVTGAGNLQASWVFHGVGPVWQGGRSGEPALLAGVYERALNALAARAPGVGTIAFPSVSTGAYGYPISSAAQVAAHAVLDFLAHNRGRIGEVRHVLFTRADFDVYAAAYDGTDAAPVR